MLGKFWWLEQASHVVQWLKKKHHNNLPAKQETWVQSLGQEDPLEKEMATPVFLPVKSPMDRGAWWAIVHGIARVGLNNNNDNTGEKKAERLC